MSECRDIQITCPHCGGQGDFRLWNSINSDLNPELVPQILDASLFQWRCPVCHELIHVPYGFLFHDMKRKVMIFYEPEEPTNKSEKYQAIELPDTFGMMDYRIRAVFGLANLQEKLMMIAYGLDDIVIEHIKFMLSHLSIPEISQQGGVVRCYGPVDEEEDGVDNEFGLLQFRYYLPNEDTTYGINCSIAHYYEHKLACDIDSRMHIKNGMCVDQELMERLLMYGGEGSLCDLQKFDTFKCCGYKCKVLDNVGGYFAFTRTVPRTKTTPTRYLYGFAHESGIVIFPTLFEHVSVMKTKRPLFYGELDERPMFIQEEGCARDLTGAHLPITKKIDKGQFFEKLVNWVLPGLQFFYRDTDMIDGEDVERLYHVGDLFHAGMRISATAKLWKPATKVRFIIASAHAAILSQNEELTKNNPKIEELNLCLFHHDSYFKVMDIYKVQDITQVLLLHIPIAAAQILGEANMDLIFQEHEGEEFMLVEMAHQSLDEKMTMEVHPRSLNSSFVSETKIPIGYDENLGKLSLEPLGLYGNKKMDDFAAMVWQMSESDDIEGFIIENDHFPFEGLEKHICKDCIYAKDADLERGGCKLLSKEKFRNRYIKNVCEYLKTSPDELSEYEEQKLEEERKAELSRLMQSGEYPLKVFREFVAHQFNGDIDALRDYDFTLPWKAPSEDKDKLEEVRKCIAYLVFADVWPDCNYEDVQKGRFDVDLLNPFFVMFGSPAGYDFGEKMFLGLDKLSPSEEVSDRVFRFCRLQRTIGNFILLPNALTRRTIECELTRAKRMWSRYPDTFMMSLREELLEEPHKIRYLQQEIHHNSRIYEPFHTEGGFHRLMSDLLLDDYLDEDGLPHQILPGIQFNDKEMDRQTYFKAVDEYLSFCERIIPLRTERILDRLKKIL